MNRQTVLSASTGLAVGFGIVAGFSELVRHSGHVDNGNVASVERCADSLQALEIGQKTLKLTKLRDGCDSFLSDFGKLSLQDGQPGAASAHSSAVDVQLTVPSSEQFLKTHLATARAEDDHTNRIIDYEIVIVGGLLGALIARLNVNDGKRRQVNAAYAAARATESDNSTL